MAPARGRLAPSPTGAQHVGNARTYLVAWLSARSQGGAVGLRVEDIDSPRVKPGAADEALDDLRWLGLDWDGDPVVQSARLPLYAAALEELKRQELVYPCTCTRSDVAAAASAPHAGDEGPPYPGTCAGRTAADADRLDRPFAWRFRVTDSPPFDDLYRGPTAVDLRQAGGDFVVWKSAGTPAYQLAVVADDATMDVTEVVRGDDLIPSTPRQLLLYRALAADPPRFAHVPLVVGPDGRRLAKRHGDTRLSALRAAGARPEALVGLLAWSCGWLDRPDPVTPRELIPLFRLAAIPPRPFVLTPERVVSLVRPAAVAVGPADRAPQTEAGSDVTVTGVYTPVTDERAVGETLHTPSPPAADLGEQDFLTDALPDDRLGGYRLIRQLGRGGMGVVYEAEDERLGRRVALKVMSPHLAVQAAFRQRFLREARAMAAVEHDYIIPVYGIGEDDGRPYLAMPLLAGQTLEARLAGGDRVPVAEAVEIGRQVALALAAAHAKNLVHRDVKPSNIWLEAEPDGSFRRVRLLDFGLTRTLADAHLTASGVVVGTPMYMAPEQARGGKVDHRADLFSLGCVLYRMTAGRPPFAGPDPASVLLAVTQHDPPPAAGANPAVPAALSKLIGRLMAKDPDARPGDARAVAEELARVGLSGSGRFPHVVRTPSSYAINLDELPDVPDLPDVSAVMPAGPAPSDPPEVRAVAWLLGLPGAVVRVRAADTLRPVETPREVTGAGEIVHTIVVPAAAEVTDDRLPLLAPLTRVRGLWLAGSAVTDAGVRALTGLPLAQTLTVLGLTGSRVTDAGVAALRAIRGLATLDLSGTALTDAGLAELVGLAAAGEFRLTRLRVRSTRVSPDRVWSQAARVPTCTVESDYGTFGPGASAGSR